MSSKDKKEPKLDPYDVLGIELGATDAVISKAYRKLALKFHPDKQQQKSAAEIERISKKFHDIKEARAFLLDPENKQARTNYDQKRASQTLRKEADEKRERTMNKRRKTMKDELKRKEQEAMKKQQQTTTTKTTKKSAKRNESSSSSSSFRQRPQQGKRKNDDDYDEELLKKLRKESSDLRQSYADRKTDEQVQKEIQKDKDNRRNLQDRQVRIKWSRKRWIGESPSEHSLATMLSSKFGSVEEVEMLGSKGNSALVTFANKSSCRPCVDEYMDSDQMRATYVGTPPPPPSPAQEEKKESSTTTSSQYDNETLQDRNIRQHAERERLLQQMKEEEEDDDDEKRWNSHKKHTKKEPNIQQPPSSFRWKLPSELFPKEYDDLPTPFEKLNKAERLVFESILPPETIEELKLF